MTLLQVLKATMIASAWFLWIAVPIACLPTAFAFAVAPRRHRWHYVVAGLLGGVASLFLSVWFYCRGQGQSCNTAQGDMGLIITLPVGSFLGSSLAVCWTWVTLRIPPESPWSSIWCYSGPSRIQNWTYAIAIPIAFWVLVTLFFARLMA